MGNSTTFLRHESIIGWTTPSQHYIEIFSLTKLLPPASIPTNISNAMTAVRSDLVIVPHSERTRSITIDQEHVVHQSESSSDSDDVQSVELTPPPRRPRASTSNSTPQSTPVRRQATSPLRNSPSAKRQRHELAANSSPSFRVQLNTSSAQPTTTFIAYRPRQTSPTAGDDSTENYDLNDIFPDEVL